MSWTFKLLIVVGMSNRFTKGKSPALHRAGLGEFSSQSHLEHVGRISNPVKFSTQCVWQDWKSGLRHPVSLASLNSRQRRSHLSASIASFKDHLPEPVGIRDTPQQHDRVANRIRQPDIARLEEGLA